MFSKIVTGIVQEMRGINGFRLEAKTIFSRNDVFTFQNI